MGSNDTSEHASLRVVVVGAGIGGLTAAVGLRLDGHEVVVLEQAAEFGEVGAGMRIPPNCFKILHRWGVDLTYMKKTYSNGNRFLRYDDGRVLAHMPHGIPEWDFGGSYLMVHRADYHAVLLQKALDLGADVRKNSKVEEYDWEKPAVHLQNGEWIEGNVLIAADGVQSKARALIVGHELPPIDTGDFSYRILIPGNVILADPELRDLVSDPWVSSWCGPDAHVIGYPVRGGEVYNVVCCCAGRSMQDRPLAANETKAVFDSNAELVRRFKDWEPRVRKIVDYAKNGYLKWRLYDLDIVERWVHPSGRAALLGDACHPMLPYMASGAAMACEDAAVLRQVLKTATRQSVPAALHQYQKIRQPRASVVQKSGRALQHAYHLEDGAEQAQRDELMTKDMTENPIYWGHQPRREWLFGHDAEADAKVTSLAA
ncbi:FAD/NAD(P)-binding domain-containing protein [Pleurostoma richardsiae]|uniref:FAD/NAD(P)-binding domain-containing protein n=1 Tax=Pleurostoma richardsiae TaxID=41990 RepID=A0AA38RG60_9PEZI|nr:FAD/NAD(P)-binding domain-containing protein [Pleurostoma richardsiae]